MHLLGCSTEMVTPTREPEVGRRSIHETLGLGADAIGHLALIGALSKYPRLTLDLDFGRRLPCFASQNLQGLPTGTKKNIRPREEERPEEESGAPETEAGGAPETEASCGKDRGRTRGCDPGNDRRKSPPQYTWLKNTVSPTPETSGHKEMGMITESLRRRTLG